jgi:hypothetical protein
MRRSNLFRFNASSGKAWLLGTNPQNGAAMAVIPATHSAIATWCAALVELQPLLPT